VKPANILLAQDGRPVLIDFGSARAVHRENDNSFTQIYSAGYAPIEQILGTAQGPFSDIYAVGSVGYRAIGGKLTGALPRYNATQAGRPDPLRPAREVGAGRYPASLLAMLDAALTLEPTARPASAEAMLRMLDGTPQDATVIGAPATSRERDDATVVAATRPRSAARSRPFPPAATARGPPRAWIAGGVGAAVLAGVIWMLLPGGTQQSLQRNVAALPSQELAPSPSRPPSPIDQLHEPVPRPPVAVVPEPARVDIPAPRAPEPSSSTAETAQLRIPVVQAPVTVSPPPAIEAPPVQTPMASPSSLRRPFAETLAPGVPPIQPPTAGAPPPPPSPPLPSPPGPETPPTQLALVQPAAPPAAILQIPQPRIVLRARETVEIAFRDPANGQILARRTLPPGATEAVPPDHEGWSLQIAAPERLEILVDGRPIPGAPPGYRSLTEIPLDPAALVRGAAFAPPEPPVHAPPVTTLVSPPPIPVAPAVPPPARRVVQPPAANSGSAARCRSILSRAQIGEPLAEADRAFLRTDCRG
jgi:hypothetical protein